MVPCLTVLRVQQLTIHLCVVKAKGNFLPIHPPAHFPDVLIVDLRIDRATIKVLPPLVRERADAESRFAKLNEDSQLRPKSLRSIHTPFSH